MTAIVTTKTISALMSAPMLTNVASLVISKPKPRELSPPATATIGLTKYVPNAPTSVVKATPMAMPTARSTTFPRIRKSLKPLIMVPPDRRTCDRNASHDHGAWLRARGQHAQARVEGPLGQTECGLLRRRHPDGHTTGRVVAS